MSGLLIQTLWKSFGGLHQGIIEDDIFKNLFEAFLQHSVLFSKYSLKKVYQAVTLKWTFFGTPADQYSGTQVDLAASSFFSSIRQCIFSLIEAQQV